MSGFAGIVSPDGGTPDTGLLQRMANRLAFRGPDAAQIWTRPGAGFCHTLLRTGPARQSSEQPCTLDDRVFLLGDVRLDGREDLRRELEQHGQPTEATATDEQLVLRVWQCWGEPGLEKLLGDLSFVIWDKADGCLYGLRDLMSGRPFFYASSRDRFCFSNTLEVLRLLPRISCDLDPHFIGDFLLQEWSGEGSRCAFRDIRRLPSGHALKYSNQGLRVRRCTELSIEEPLRLKQPVEYVERFRNLLDEAISDRLPTSPSAIFLSGGLDSGSVAAVATKIGRNRGKPGLAWAHTVDSRPLFHDEEGALASLVAKKLGLHKEILPGASCLPYEGWGEPELRTPEPIHDPFLKLSLLQYRQVAAKTRVCFTGYGGDDVLNGQAWPYLLYLLRRGRLDLICTVFGSYLVKHGHIPPLRGGFRSRLRSWMGHTNPFTDFPAWLEPGFAAECGLRDRCLELQSPPKTSHPLHPIAHAGLSSESWPAALEMEDAAWTSVPVETRSPLLDLRMLRFLLRVPPVPWCMKKELLREAMRGLLPEEIRLRPKTPVPVEPIDRFIENGSWSPFPLPELANGLGAFVDVDKLSATLRTSTGSTLWVALRPVSLSCWLKAVENR